MFFSFIFAENQIIINHGVSKSDKNDPWLAPYEAAIEGRYQYVIDKEKSLTNNGKLTLSEMASGYLYFGLHKTTKGWCSVNGRRMLPLFI